MAAAGTPAGGAVSNSGSLIARYDTVLLDVDGVVRRGSDPIPGAGVAVETLHQRGIAVAFVTNNASATPAQVVQDLALVGVAAQPEQVVTSSLAAAALLPPGTACLVIGMEGLRTALRERGCTTVTEPDAADAVVVGFDRNLVWDDLRRATLALHRGVRFVATNTDATFPAAEGLWPGNGAIVAALERSSGRTAEVAGKPNTPLLELAAQRAGGGRVLFVGDRHETDIVGAAQMGWDTALVLTGITQARELPSLRPAPTYVFASLGELVAAPQPVHGSS